MNKVLIPDICTDIKEKIHHNISRIDIGDTAKRLTQSKKPIIVRFELDLGKIAIGQWLDKQSFVEKVYWCDRNSEFEFAGVGQADVVHSPTPESYHHLFQKLAQRIDKHHKNIRYFGGMSFSSQDDLRGSSWEKFGSFRFVLPRFELIQRTEDSCQLSCNICFDASSTVGDDIDSLHCDVEKLEFGSEKSENKIPLFRSREDQPSCEEYKKKIRQILSQINDKEIDKIVLARKSSFYFSNSVNPLSIMERIKNISSNSYIFCFQIAKNKAFTGATPERLFQKHDNRVLFDAVAGTRNRGKTDEDDHRLALDLLHSEKDRREHDFVVNHLKSSLSELKCKFRTDSEVTILKLHRVQHLAQKVMGELPEHVKEADLLKSLQPTSAVGGYPQNEALKQIKKNEPFCRGWYAGPVGWIGVNQSELAVAIRSAMIEDDRIDAYAGAGIVDGSNPDEEWEEVESKLMSFASTLIH